MAIYLIRGQLISSGNKTDRALPLPSILSPVSSAPSSCRVHGPTLCIPSLNPWNLLSEVSAILRESLFLLTRRATCAILLTRCARVPGSSSRAGPWGRVWHFRSEGTPRITISFLSRDLRIAQAYPQLDSGYGSGITQCLLHYTCPPPACTREGLSPRPAGSMDQSPDDGRGSTLRQFPRSHRSL